MSNKSKDADPKQPDSSFIQLDDAKQQGAASAASAPRRKALLGVLTAACTILIVVSLGFVHPSESGAWSIDWIIQTVTGESRLLDGIAAQKSIFGDHIDAMRAAAPENQKNIQDYLSAYCFGDFIRESFCPSTSASC